MKKCQILNQYSAKLKEMGYNRFETLQFIAPENIVAMNLLVGHRHLLVNAVKQMVNKPVESKKNSS